MNTKTGIIASMLSMYRSTPIDFDLKLFNSLKYGDTNRRYGGKKVKITKGKRHKSLRIRSNRRKAK